MKKTYKRKNIKIISTVCALALTTGLLSGCSDAEEAYVPAADTALSDLVAELAAGGDSLAEGYAGEFGLWGVPTAAEGLRERFTNAETAENVTFMVYMIGADLESEGGAASLDIQEMLNAENGSALNVVMQTGGAKEWQNDVVSADSRQRWLIQDGELTLCDEQPLASMATRESLGEFIAWSAENFPADRYMLVLWDHGGGTLAGYGCDELFPDDSLSLSEMAGAVRDSGVKLDLMAYDACLMGTLEVAYAFEPVADYLLASEETEPGDGWFYTDALAALSKTPNMPTVEFGARLIDSYADFYAEAYGSADVTLSLLELREIPQLYANCVEYYANAEQSLSTGQSGFTNLSVARSGTRSYGDGEYEQIDLVDYVQRTDVVGGDALVRAAFSAVKYRNESTLSGSYGMAVYFPYLSPEYYSFVMESLSEVNYTGGQSFYNAFLSVLEGGESSGPAVDWMPEEEQPDLSGEDWYDATLAENYDYQSISDSEELIVDYSEELNAHLLTLSDEEWEAITDIQLQVMLDDGEGYIDLGSDQQFDWTDNGELVLDFDDSWVSIDGHPAAFYAVQPVQDGDWTLFTGTSPALLNDTLEVDLYLRWKQDENGEGTASVLGYIPTETGAGTRPRGYLPLKSGDTIQLLCDYYTYDGVYEDSYYLGDAFTVTSQEELVVDWYDLEESTVICWLRLTDWFNQYWYTETIEISYS